MSGLKTLLLIIIIVFIIGIITLKLNSYPKNVVPLRNNTFVRSKPGVILIWTSVYFWSHINDHIDCGSHNCIITTNKSMQSKSDLIVFNTAFSSGKKCANYFFHKGMINVWY